MRVFFAYNNTFSRGIIMKKRTAIALTLLMTTAGVFATGCGEKKAQPEEEIKILEVDVVKPMTGNVEVGTQFSGSLEYQDTIAVYPKLTGEVTETFFEEGDHVNAGDLLFTLDDESYQMSLKSAKAVYNSAKVGQEAQMGALQMQRDSDVNSVLTAQEGIAQVGDSYRHMEEQYGDLEDTKSDLQTDRDDMSDDKSKLKKKLKKAKEGLSDAQDALAAATGAYRAAISLPVEEQDPDEIAALKQAMDDASNAVKGATEAVTSLTSAYNSMSTAIKTYDSNIDTIESNQKNLAYQKNNLNYSYNQAVRGAALAQENLDYFDQYTGRTTAATTEAQVKQAEVGVEGIELQIENTRITAPVSGTIQTKSVDKYDMASAGMPAYVIISDGGILASFKVPETTKDHFYQDQPVTVERNGKEYLGKITEIPTQVDPVSGLFVVKALVEGDSSELVSQTAVKITAVTNRAENVMTVPVDTVYYEGGDAFVYVAQNNVVKKVYVETGLYDDEKIQIVDGVTPDMQVITTWSSELRDGLEIKMASPKVTEN